MRSKFTSNLAFGPLLIIVHDDTLPKKVHWGNPAWMVMFQNTWWVLGLGGVLGRERAKFSHSACLPGKRGRIFHAGVFDSPLTLGHTGGIMFVT